MDRTEKRALRCIMKEPKAKSGRSEKGLVAFNSFACALFGIKVRSASCSFIGFLKTVPFNCLWKTPAPVHKCVFRFVFCIGWEVYYFRYTKHPISGLVISAALTEWTALMTIEGKDRACNNQLSGQQLPQPQCLC